MTSFLYQDMLNNLKKLPLITSVFWRRRGTAFSLFYDHRVFGGRSLSDVAAVSFWRRLRPSFFSRRQTKQAVNYVLFLQCSNTNKLFSISSYEPKHWNSPITEERKVELKCHLNATHRWPKRKIPEGTSLAQCLGWCTSVNPSVRFQDKQIRGRVKGRHQQSNRFDSNVTFLFFLAIAGQIGPRD